MAPNRCEEQIEDTIIRDLMSYAAKHYEIARDEHGDYLCGEFHFVFVFKYRSHRIPITVERDTNRIAHKPYITTVKGLNKTVEKFLGMIEDASKLLIPGLTTKREGNRVTRFAVVRRDVDADDTNPARNRAHLVNTLVRLTEQLDGLPPDFFAD